LSFALGVLRKRATSSAIFSRASACSTIMSILCA
jgi:hypothetical protein